ncbi:MAG: FadR family transcriptional regulator [Eubacterium sp.]|nr:FadR family transcriptional regulator [Eubacterium sp.]MBR0396680.1 FadR family transcriptional regulator [Eubacterium sp.]
MADYINSNESRRSTLANQIANQLVDYIQENKLQAGDRLPSEFELAELFNVGRGTVREAVKILVSRNILEIRRAKGTFVCENIGVTEDPFGFNFVPDKTELVDDLFEIRFILERYFVNKAANYITKEKLEEMRQIVRQIDEHVDDHDFCVSCDIKFHQCIMESSQNLAIPVVLPVITSNINYFNQTPFVRRWEVANNGHKAILDALEKRDGELAEEEMIRHLAYVLERRKRPSVDPRAVP